MTKKTTREDGHRAHTWSKRASGNSASRNLQREMKSNCTNTGPDPSKSLNLRTLLKLWVQRKSRALSSFLEIFCPTLPWLRRGIVERDRPFWVVRKREAEFCRSKPGRPCHFSLLLWSSITIQYHNPVSQSILSPLPNSDLLRGLSYPSVAAQRQQ